MRTLNSLKCKTKNCNKTYMVEGYCTYHYLKLLDKFEKKSRKTNLKVEDKNTIRYKK